jgi:tRNA(Ile)-lysidine synthase
LILPWQGEGELIWTPLSALLKLSYTTGQGISFAKLRDKPVTFRLRNGGERLRPNAKASTRSLKNLLQEYALPPWRRERLPLMYCGEELVSVVGVAVAADYQAQSGEKSVLVSCE